MFMKSLRIICSLLALLFLTTACNQERVNLEPSPQKEGCLVRGFIDNGSGRLVEIGTLRAIDQDGISVTGDGAYFFNQECLLRIFRTTKKKQVEYVIFNYTANYSPLVLPKTFLDYKRRTSPTIPNANPDDIYFKFPVIGDVTFIVKTKDVPGGIEVDPE